MSKQIDRLSRAVFAGVDADQTDGQLLECFVSRRDEAAVTALVHRHGPMVWGVCRRVLRNHGDAEDAFQATFLVLVRRAASILPRDMVGNWLYGVAHQTALKARATMAKRQAREKRLGEMPEPAVVTQPDLWRDLELLLDQELSCLKDKYRAALVLCDLEGKSRKQAAHQLQIPEGTLSSRLTTARTLLAKRLARHGLTASAAMLAAALSEKASASMPRALASTTIHAATLLAAGQTAMTGVTSPQIAALTHGVLKTMLLTRLQTMTAVLLVVGVSACTCIVLARGQGAGSSQSIDTSAATSSREQADPNARREPPVAQPEVDRVRPGDRLRVQVLNALPEHPIDGIFQVEPGGTIPLGPAYGRIKVKGLTLEEAEDAIHDNLMRKQLKDPRVQVTLEDPREQRPPLTDKEIHREPPAPQAPKDVLHPGHRVLVQVYPPISEQTIDGVFRVEPAGTLALGPLGGRVQVKGLTIEEAERAIKDKLEQANMVRNARVQVAREDPVADDKTPPLERRVRQLEDEVRKLRTTVEQLQRQNQK
jgi:RNA polymerase sigma factor (sigma-70 family)